PLSHRLTFPRYLASFRREHSGFSEQLPDCADKQPRQQPRRLSFTRSRRRLVGHKLYLYPGERLSCWPGFGDGLYQRHSERCEAFARYQTPPVRASVMCNIRTKTMKTLHSLVAGIWPAFSIVRQRIAFPLLFLGAGLVLVQPCVGAPFEFEETGSLGTGRFFH